MALSGFRVPFLTSPSFALLAFLGAFSKMGAVQGQAFLFCPGFRTTFSILALPTSSFSSPGFLGCVSLASVAPLRTFGAQAPFILCLGTS